MFWNDFEYGKKNYKYSQTCTNLDTNLKKKKK